VTSRLRSLIDAKRLQLLDGGNRTRSAPADAKASQIELLVEVRRGLATVVTARKQLEGQAARLEAQAEKLYGQARSALAVGQDENAREALRRRFAMLAQATELTEQADVLAAHQGQLQGSERAFTDRVRRFRVEQDALKANFDAAAAMVAIGEAATGLGKGMSDAGLAVQAARDRGQAAPVLAPGVDLDSELARLRVLLDGTGQVRPREDDTT
jgi:phage shock protein A